MGTEVALIHKQQEKMRFFLLLTDTDYESVKITGLRLKNKTRTGKICPVPCLEIADLTTRKFCG